MTKAEVHNDALAETIGVSASVPTRWRTGAATPSLPNAIAIAGALGCDLAWLLTGHSDDQEAPPSAATGAAERLREIGGRLTELAREAEDYAESLLA